MAVSLGGTSAAAHHLQLEPEPEPEPEPEFFVLEPAQDLPEQEHRYAWRPEELAQQAAVLKRLLNEDLDEDNEAQGEEDCPAVITLEQHTYPWRPEEIAEQAAVLKALQKRFGEHRQQHRSARTLWNLARTAVVLHLNLVHTAALPRHITFFSPPQPRRVALHEVEGLFLDGTLNRNSLVRVDGSDADYQSFVDFVEHYGLQEHFAELEDTCRKAFSPSPNARRELVLHGKPDGGLILTPTRIRQHGTSDGVEQNGDRKEQLAINLAGKFTAALGDKQLDPNVEAHQPNDSTRARGGAFGEETDKDKQIAELKMLLDVKSRKIVELSAIVELFERACAKAKQALEIE